jgi:poly(hydroxyalkanoate) depolymerase family esterase
MPAGAGRWLRGLAMAAGGMRQFQLYLPMAAPGQQRTAWPLMVMLHGCHQDAASFAHSTRMHRQADRAGFAVLFVQQDRRANAQGCWNWFDQRSGGAAREMQLVLAAIDQACLLYGTDAGRVAVAGLSAGASLAALLAQSHPERFSAVVMHSGVPPGAAHNARTAVAAMQGRQRHTAAPPDSAAGPAWPPLLVIHGDSDRVVVPRHADDAVAQWLARTPQARAGAPAKQQRGKRRAALVQRWACRGRDVATQVLVQGMGHAWSGGPAALPFCDATGPDASTLATRFVLSQWRAIGDGALSRRAA